MRNASTEGPVAHWQKPLGGQCYHSALLCPGDLTEHGDRLMAGHGMEWLVVISDCLTVMTNGLKSAMAKDRWQWNVRRKYGSLRGT